METKRMKRNGCQRCGACCRQPGFVLLESGEAAAIAAFLGIEETKFANDFANLSPDRGALILKEKPDDACIFLSEENTCEINPVKPAQCRNFPNTWRNEDSEKICPVAREG